MNEGKDDATSAQRWQYLAPNFTLQRSDAGPDNRLRVDPRSLDTDRGQRDSGSAPCCADRAGVARRGGVPHRRRRMLAFSGGVAGDAARR